MNSRTLSKLIEMKVEMFTSGPFQTNCCVVSCEEEGKAIIVDPGFDELGETESLVKFIGDNRLVSEFVVDTHGHPDHTCGNGIMKKRFGSAHKSLFFYLISHYGVESPVARPDHKRRRTKNR